MGYPLRYLRRAFRRLAPPFDSIIMLWGYQQPLQKKIKKERKKLDRYRQKAQEKMSKPKKIHQQHTGELFVQRKRHAPPDHSDVIGQIIESDIPARFATFYQSINYLPLGTMDATGNLWATVLCNPTTTIISKNTLVINATVPREDPFVTAVLSVVPAPRYFAGVAVDFRSRRRVKLAGIIESVIVSDDNVLTLTLLTNENMGNCPKYITTRELRPTIRRPQTFYLGKRLDVEARAVIEQASTIFIATKHMVEREGESDLGFNHRGGPKGFLRYFEDDKGAHLVLPDYSGNRFYQSLGNVQSDNSMGIVIPDFFTGHLLHLHGKAENLYDGEAEALMPGATLITLITIGDSVLMKHSMNLEIIGDEELSPYNPKRRLLAIEKNEDVQVVQLKARLVETIKDSQNISTFTFQLHTPVDILPGGHAIFDLSHFAPKQYQHMNDENPSSLNDDYVRTWTVSRISEDKKQISITVKKCGVVSSFLHTARVTEKIPFEVVLRGFGGNFSCFEETQLKTSKMLWVAGGVGITPFLAMYRRLIAIGAEDYDIELFYSCRGDEVALIKEMTKNIRIRVFDSNAKRKSDSFVPFTLEQRRVGETDFNSIPNLSERTAYLCGPVSYMEDVRDWLKTRINPNNIQYEHFNF